MDVLFLTAEKKQKDKSPTLQKSTKVDSRQTADSCER